MTSETDRQAADAIRAHHRELYEGLRGRVEALIAAAPGGPADAERAAVLAFLDDEIIPHARAEEAALYPAGETGAATLLVQAMRQEHHGLISHVERLRAASGSSAAATEAAAVLALFESHLWKENELLVPAILADPSRSLEALLRGMHELVG